MRLANSHKLLAGVALIAALPVLAQDAPESILPPGFGDPVQQAPRDTGPSRPADIAPPASPTSAPPGSPPTDLLDPNGELLAEGEDVPLEKPVLADLPPGARRSTALVGLAEPEDGGLGQTAFGAANGPYLAALMRATHAPIASRWASILLRRALVSKAATPAGINGADWVAERAWLLVRMGEADAARQLVQAVDVDQYTPRLFDVALQAALASADPAALCPLADPASQISKVEAWRFAKAICAGLSGEAGPASAQIDGARATAIGRGIDGILAEKVVGAGVNTRRSVNVKWDGVDRLTAWRFGMAAATAVEIPDALWGTAGRQVMAWRARAPLYASETKRAAVETAALLGVFSSAALVDFYGGLSDADDEDAQASSLSNNLADAYSGADASSRMSALRTIWTVADGGRDALYLRHLLTARAAARFRPSDDFSGDLDGLISSMMTAGLDLQAARWAPRAETGSLAWALLAVGAPGQAVPWDEGALDDVDNGNGRRRQFLFAGMAGLARITPTTASGIAGDLGVPIGREDRWTKALETAVNAREPATVALLCAVGLQGNGWDGISPARLYHVVSALRRAGLGAEARMIAAEAVTRA